MKLSTLAELKKVAGKRVLVRVDFNVPLDARGRIAGDADSRIRAAIPTIQKLRTGGAKVILASHLGRPKRRDPALSLMPVARRLAELLGEKVSFVSLPIDDHAVDKKIAAMKDGDVTLLENLRFYKGEDDNGTFFARRLASLADAYVDDAFAVAHRETASNVGIAKLLPSYAGLLFAREVAALAKVDGSPKRPYVVMMGGAKIESKLPTLKRLLTMADTVLVGGGLANSFFRAAGHSTGLSHVDAEEVRLAKVLWRRYQDRIRLPVDVLVSTKVSESSEPRYALPSDVKKNEHIVDVGAATVREWAKVIRKAKTLVWNGPLGLYEIKKFSHGTMSLGRLVASRSSGKAFGVVGGGETVQALERTGLAEYVDHVSTGGGAMLDFLAGKTLPGVNALMK